MSGLTIRRSILDGLSLGFLQSAVYFAVTQPNKFDLETDISGAAGMVALFLSVGIAVSYFLTKSGVETLGARIFRGPVQVGTEAAESWYKSFWGTQLIVTFLLMVVVGIVVTEVSVRDFFDKDGAQGALRIFQGMVQPNFEILPKAIVAMVVTIFIAFIATVFAVPVAFLLAFFSARNLMSGSGGQRFIYGLLRSLSNITRSIEPIIWAIIFSVWVSIGPFAGALALMLHSIASLTKQYSEIIECVDEGPIEGIQTTGASGIQTVWFAVVPQIILPYVSFTIYRWDINVRMATVIGLVGGGGVGQLLMQYQGMGKWPEVGTLVLLITAVVWSMDAASSYVREAIK
jgi:phosphonate transport system permease protein